jgi:signal transduction histidine kinase
VLDLFVPLGVANGVLYSGAVLLAYIVTPPSFALAAAVASSALVVIGVAFGPVVPGVPVWLGVANRAFSLLVIWVPVLFFAQRREAERALRQAHDELEMKVRERTAELADVNKALVAEISERMETERSLRASEDALQASQRALRQSSEDLQALAARLLTAQEEDRRRISRDLHDDINQRLAMIAVDVETLSLRPPDSKAALGRSLWSVQDRIVEMSEDIRRFVHQLHPSILDDLGLPIALQQLMDDFAGRTGLKSTFRHADVPPALSRDLATCFYRIAQESLSNVARHADASRVEMDLTGVDDGLALSITDDGRGFDRGKIGAAPAGLGLVSMNERLRLVGGALDVTSGARTGTTVRAWAPVPGDPS